MRIKAFISHNSIDKPFVRKIAKDLSNQNIYCWVDEGEIKAGDSLILKISDGLDTSDYVLAILSDNSIKSNWVTKELSIAITQEINHKTIKVIPIILNECKIPTFISDKLYIDFSKYSSYDDAFIKLLYSMNVSFNKKAFYSNGSKSDLGTAIDKAINNSFPILSKPFHRPFQYIGLTIDEASKSIGIKHDKNNNLIVENDECKMLLESEGNFISYIDIEFKKYKPFKINNDFDPDIVFGSLSINPEEFDFVSKSDISREFYDHSKQLQIIICEQYQGGPLTIGFGKKYYGTRK